MGQAAVGRDGNRLPWLEPYRTPERRKSNRTAGIVAIVGAAGLAGVAALVLTRGAPAPEPSPSPPQASVVLPAPADMQPQVVLPPLETHVDPDSRVAAAEPPAITRRAKALPRRRIKALPTQAAYRQVIREQGEKLPELDPQVSAAAIAIASLPVTPDPPRPAVNPAARIVRGKTVQLGVYRTAGQAEAAWRSAVRDYTYLVTMPKHIEAISIRSRRFYRLQLGTPSKKHAKQLCDNLKSIGRACKVA